MSQCGNNNKLAQQHVPCDRLLQKAYLERLLNDLCFLSSVDSAKPWFCLFGLRWNYCTFSHSSVWNCSSGNVSFSCLSIQNGISSRKLLIGHHLPGSKMNLSLAFPRFLMISCCTSLRMILLQFSTSLRCGLASRSLSLFWILKLLTLVHVAYIWY